MALLPEREGELTIKHSCIQMNYTNTDETAIVILLSYCISICMLEVIIVQLFL